MSITTPERVYPGTARTLSSVSFPNSSILSWRVSVPFNSSSLRNPARTAIMCLHTQINSILHIHHLKGNCVECAGPHFPNGSCLSLVGTLGMLLSALLRLAMHHGNGNEGTIHSLFVISREIVGFSTRRSGFLCGGWSRYICMFSYTHWWNR